MTVYRDPTHIDLDKEYQITELVKFVREKMYGYDVREAFALALERVYNDASQNGNANMEVSFARGTHKNLNARLNLHENQIENNQHRLSKTMAQTEFDSWVATLLDGGPSIFYETLASLEPDYPNGAAGVALVRETDPARIYVWNEVERFWEDFGAYQGIEIKDGTVTVEKLSPQLQAIFINEGEVW